MVTTGGIDPCAAYTLKEAAQACGMPYVTLYRHHRAGRLNVVRMKWTESLYVRGDELIRFIDELFEEVRR